MDNWSRKLEWGTWKISLLSEPTLIYASADLFPTLVRWSRLKSPRVRCVKRLAKLALPLTNRAWTDCQDGNTASRVASEKWRRWWSTAPMRKWKCEGSSYTSSSNITSWSPFLLIHTVIGWESGVPSCGEFATLGLGQYILHWLCTPQYY